MTMGVPVDTSKQKGLSMRPESSKREAEDRNEGSGQYIETNGGAVARIKQGNDEEGIGGRDFYMPRDSGRRAAILYMGNLDSAQYCAQICELVIDTCLCSAQLCPPLGSTSNCHVSANTCIARIVIGIYHFY